MLWRLSVWCMSGFSTIGWSVRSPSRWWCALSKQLLKHTQSHFPCASLQTPLRSALYPGAYLWWIGRDLNLKGEWILTHCGWNLLAASRMWNRWIWMLLVFVPEEKLRTMLHYWQSCSLVAEDYQQEWSFFRQVPYRMGSRGWKGLLGRGLQNFHLKALLLIVESSYCWDLSKGVPRNMEL